MNEIEDIESYGTLYEELPPIKEDPLDAMRKRFNLNAENQVQALIEDKPLGRAGWSKRREGGKYSVSLRNGTTTMQLKGEKKYSVVSSKEIAIKFYRDMIDKCSAGKLDGMLKATQRKSPRVTSI